MGWEPPAGAFRVYFRYTGPLGERDLFGRLMGDSPRPPDEVLHEPSGAGSILYAADEDTTVSDRDQIVEWLRGFAGMDGVRWESTK